MRMRPLVACSVILALAATSSAVAAPRKRKLCYLVVDDKGDGHAQTGGAVLKSRAMDIHSADVATGPKTLVAAIRLETTDSRGDPVAALGLEWTFTFTIRGQKYTFKRDRSTGLDPTYTDRFYSDEISVTPEVKVDATMVKWTVQRTQVPELTKRGKWVLDTLAANGKVFVTNGDHSASDNTYPDKHPHCLDPK